MWFYSKDDAQQGPVEADVIQRMLENGELSQSTLVWKEGMGDWVPLGQVSELRGGNAADPAPTASTTTPTTQPQPQMPQLVAPPQQNTMALTSMILGLISVMTCLLTSIPAIICGHIANKQMRESAYPQTGQGMAKTGLILGYIFTVLSILGIIAYVGIIVFAVSAGGTP